MWFALVMITRINFMAAFAGPELDEGFRQGFTLRMLTVLFPLGIFFWVLATPGLSRVSQDLANRCRYTPPSATLQKHSKQTTGMEKEYQIALVFLLVSATTIAMYLKTVPLMSTGLVTLFTDPINSTMAREESLKLVTSPLVRYSYLWHTVVLAPLLVGLAVQARLPIFSLRNLLRIGLVIILIVSVMLTGARAPGGRLFLLMGLIALLRMGLRRGTLTFIPGAAVAMVIAALISNLREGKIEGMDIMSLYGTVSTGIFNRVFETAYETGVWANHLAQDLGNFGIASIRPLAALFGVPFIDVANLSGLTFAHNPLATINATTCFLFAYQAAFGLVPGWLLSLGLVCALDLLLPLFLDLRGRLLTAFLAAFLMANMVLVGSNFTTALLSQGILPVALLAWLSGKFISTGEDQ